MAGSGSAKGQKALLGDSINSDFPSMMTLLRLIRDVARLTGRFADDTRGNIALMAALIGPAVLLLGVGAIDLMAVHRARTAAVHCRCRGSGRCAASITGH